MNTISHSQRYLPHELTTRYHAVKLYKSNPISFVCRRYKISKASLLRWNKRFDGTMESLADRSHRPLTQHPNAHTIEEKIWITNIMRRNPHMSHPELYGKLRVERGYKRHPASLFRYMRTLGYYTMPLKKKSLYTPKKYDTPKSIGIKWQLDVKYVPKQCYSGKRPDKFYQYTVIDEASRQRFLYPYLEQTSYSTIDFIQRAIKYFGYKPQIIQTDNGAEFTHTRRTNRTHSFDLLLQQLKIKHQLIRPRTPRHNGKVERSHRNDNERFYQFIKFYNYKDLKYQMKSYLKRSNNIPMQVLNWVSPIQKRNELISQL